MQKGTIIFLNGVSSSGKTTLAKFLQTRLSEPFYLLSFDTFIGMAPKKSFNEKYPEPSFALHHTIKMFSDIGINVIVDHVLLKCLHIMDECVEILHEYPLLFVHVICPLEELRRREIEREHTDPRQIGMAEWQLTDLVPQNTYDITVNTFTHSTKQCADKIIELLNYPEKFTAFKTLWSQRTK